MIFSRQNCHEMLGRLIFKLDTTKYFFDTPKFDYQPLPWVGINNAQIRGEATYDRWEAIKPAIPSNAATLKDVGCCVGFFCHKASEELKLFSIGIDSDSRFIRIARHVANSKFNSSDETFLELAINPRNVSLIPDTDITILFSVWHHWVYDFGLDSATQMLKETWRSTNMVLFFESGEEEIQEEFNIDFNGNAKLWLVEYLARELVDSQVDVIGDFESGKYEHYRIQNHSRTVFAVKKINYL